MIEIKYFEELLIRSSIQVLMTDKTTMKPVAFGSGCIMKHNDRYFFLSVEHVTNRDLLTCLETNLPSDGLTTPIQPIGGLNYLSPLETMPEADIEELEKELQKPFQPLDITFAEIKTPIELLQEEIDFRNLKIESGQKIILCSKRIAEPSSELTYGFYGKIRQDYTVDEVYLKMTPSIKAPLKYHRQKGDFYIFKAPKTITDKGDYEGCSGAPIMDIDGNLVALACMVIEGTNMIFGFSMSKCLELINTLVDSGAIDFDPAGNS